MSRNWPYGLNLFILKGGKGWADTATPVFMSVILLGRKNYDVLFSTLNGSNAYQYEKENLAKFVRDLYSLNTMSYNVRYGEEMPIPKEYEPNYEPPVQEIQLYKLLQCILYQIELTPEQLEKDNKSELAESLRFAEAMLQRLASGIIYKLPTYQKAAWGL